MSLVKSNTAWSHQSRVNDESDLLIQAAQKLSFIGDERMAFGTNWCFSFFIDIPPTTNPAFFQAGVNTIEHPYMFLSYNSGGSVPKINYGLYLGGTQSGNIAYTLANGKHHIVFQNTATVLTVYVDGKVINTSTSNQNFDFTGKEFRLFPIGAGQIGGSHFAILNRGMTADEISYVFMNGGVLPESTHPNVLTYHPLTQRTARKSLTGESVVFDDKFLYGALRMGSRLWTNENVEAEDVEFDYADVGDSTELIYNVHAKGDNIYFFRRATLRNMVIKVTIREQISGNILLTREFGSSTTTIDIGGNTFQFTTQENYVIVDLEATAVGWEPRMTLQEDNFIAATYDLLMFDVVDRFNYAKTSGSVTLVFALNSLSTINSYIDPYYMEWSQSFIIYDNNVTSFVIRPSTVTGISAVGNPNYQCNIHIAKALPGTDEPDPSNIITTSKVHSSYILSGSDIGFNVGSLIAGQKYIIWFDPIPAETTLHDNSNKIVSKVSNNNPSYTDGIGGARRQDSGQAWIALNDLFYELEYSVDNTLEPIHAKMIGFTDAQAGVDGLAPIGTSINDYYDRDELDVYEAPVQPAPEDNIEIISQLPPQTKALEINGTSQFLTTAPFNIPATNGYTVIIGCQAPTEPLKGVEYMIADTLVGGGFNLGAGPTPHAWSFGGNSFISVPTTALFTDFNIIAMTGAAQAKLYENGVVTGTNSGANLNLNLGNPLYIGGTSGNRWTGRICFFSLYSRILSLREIKELVNNTLISNPLPNQSKNLELLIDFANPYDDAGTLKFPDLSENDNPVTVSGYADLSDLIDNLIPLGDLKDEPPPPPLGDSLLINSDPGDRFLIGGTDELLINNATP